MISLGLDLKKKTIADRPRESETMDIYCPRSFSEDQVVLPLISLAVISCRSVVNLSISFFTCFLVRRVEWGDGCLATSMGRGTQEKLHSDNV